MNCIGPSVAVSARVNEGMPQLESKAPGFCQLCCRLLLKVSLSLSKEFAQSFLGTSLGYIPRNVGVSIQHSQFFVLSWAGQKASGSGLAELS